MDRVSIGDLALAAEWLDYYDGSNDDSENEESAKRVAAWLRTEIHRRQEKADVRSLVNATGATSQQAKSALRKVKERKDHGTPKD